VSRRESQLGEKINILRHSLVPKASKLSEKDIEKLFAKFNISKIQLPSISVKDPMAKALNLETGDIIKIERTSPSGKDLYYRRVVE
jgi:DNA-directed RNA polymerase subunit H (RpoH/RPB5)